MTAYGSFDLIPSVGIDDRPTFACVTNSDAYGHGVFSWHTSEGDANHNAQVTGGTVEPVTLDADGLAEVPAAAAHIIDRRLGIS